VRVLRSAFWNPQPDNRGPLTPSCLAMARLPIPSLRGCFVSGASSPAVIAARSGEGTLGFETVDRASSGTRRSVLNSLTFDI